MYFGGPQAHGDTHECVRHYAVQLISCGLDAGYD